MEWRSDAELFELIRTTLYTPVVGDLLDVLVNGTAFYRRQFSLSKSV